MVQSQLERYGFRCAVRPNRAIRLRRILGEIHTLRFRVRTLQFELDEEQVRAVAASLHMSETFLTRLINRIELELE